MHNSKSKLVDSRVWSGGYILVGTVFLAVLLGTGCAHQSVAVDVVLVPYECKRVSGVITIDGHIGEVAWQAAEALTNFYAYSPKDAANLSPTEARVLWDSDNLYVAISCTDADVWSYSDQADDELWYGDVVEVFFKPDRDTPVYYEFVAAPNETLFDARHPSRGAGGFRRFKTWSSGARVSAFINGTDGEFSDTDSGYTIEMAIPLSAFHGATPPADGVVWTFCICRYDYSKLLDAPLLLMTMPQAPHGFHSYEGYTDLVFKGKGIAQ